MAMIQLHTPILLSDNETTTEYEANNIIHVQSVFGDDDSGGTNFYISGVPEKQFCLESANTVKQLIQENETKEDMFSVGSIHIGDQVNQNGVMFWWKDAKFQAGVVVGLVIGFLSSMMASWAFTKIFV
jgi:hypothetical protein